MKALILLAVFCASVSASPVVYQLNHDGSVTVATRHLGAISFEPPRAMPNFPYASPELNCVVKEQESVLPYKTERRCDSVHWPVNYQPALEDGFDVAKQINRTWRDNWLLFEWQSLPRLTHHAEIDVCRPDGGACSRLPSIQQAPLIMSWGERVIKIDHQGFSLFLRGDLPLILDAWPQMEQDISQDISALVQLFGGSPSTEWDITFVGIDKSHGTLGGASGDNGWVANIVTSNGKADPAFIPHMQWVAIHETLHRLITAAPGEWANESLVEYYSYKVVSQRETLPSLAKEWEKFLTRFPSHDVSLAEAWHKSQSPENYLAGQVIYRKGSLFWQELDQALQSASSNQRSLDDFVKYLLVAGNTTALPEHFQGKVVELLGAESWQKLKAKYGIS